jgi:hypothetical protein
MHGLYGARCRLCDGLLFHDARDDAATIALKFSSTAGQLMTFMNALT